MSYKLTIVAQAEQDIHSSFGWYRLRDIRASLGFLAAVDECTLRIAAAPMSFPQVGGGKRSVRLDRFPFRIYYEVEGPEVLILRVHHMKRRTPRHFPKR